MKARYYLWLLSFLVLTGCAGSAGKEKTQSLIHRHLQRHSHMQVKDVYKLLYQSCFGPAHILKYRQAARQYLSDELAKITAHADQPLIEVIHPEAKMLRINLKNFKYRNLSAQTLFECMVESAQQEMESKQEFIMRWQKFIDGIDAGKFGFDKKQAQKFWQQVSNAGLPAVHHSNQYRDTNQPAYRVVTKASWQKRFGK